MKTETVKCKLCRAQQVPGGAQNPVLSGPNISICLRPPQTLPPQTPRWLCARKRCTARPGVQRGLVPPPALQFPQAGVPKASPSNCTRVSRGWGCRPSPPISKHGSGLLGAGPLWAPLGPPHLTPLPQEAQDPKEAFEGDPKRPTFQVPSPRMGILAPV